MAVPTAGTTIEQALPMVQYNGLNTLKASNLAGFLVDASGNTTVPGTLAVTGAASFSGTQIGLKHVVTGSGGATRTLTAANSGSVNLFDSAAGIAYTLPATAIGLYYDFVWSVTQTSSAHSVTTPASSFLVGGINLMIAASATTLACQANGSSNTTISTNGTTTGGIIGGAIRITAVSATVWAIQGQIFGSGTLATPIA